MMRSRATRSSSAPVHRASPILVASASRPTYQVRLTSVADQRFDLDLDRQKMRDPLLDHLAERVEPAPLGGKIERHVEQIAALPIALGIAVVEHVDLARHRQA